MDNDGKDNTIKQTTAANPTVITLNLRPKLGAEYENAGGYVYGSFNPGISPIFDATDLTYTYGARLFGGIKSIKALIEWEGGKRHIGANRWTDPEENGRGKSKIQYNDYTLGLRFSWYDNERSAGRNHLSLGVVQEILNRKNIDRDEEWGPYRVQNIYTESGALAKNKGVFGILAKNKTTYQGYIIEFQKDHHSIFKAKFFPKYPLTGFTNGQPESSDLADKDHGFYFNVSYTRSIDWYF